MTLLVMAFIIGALVGSIFPAIRLDPSFFAYFAKKTEADPNPWDERFW